MFEGNLEYSEDKCIFVPQTLNQIFQGNLQSKYGLPIGVRPYGKNKYYAIVRNNITKRNIYGNPCLNIEDAHAEYIELKRNYIFNLAEYYKDIIPEKLHEKLLYYSKFYIKKR